MLWMSMLVWLSGIAVEINGVRSTYRLAIKQSDKADELVSITRDNISNATYRAYYAMGKALQAKHGWNPASRLSLAKEASVQLNKAVDAAPGNLEVRYLRFSFESKVPALLGLTLHTTQDKAWIMAHLDKKHPMWDLIRAFLKESELLTADEKLKL